MASVISGIIIVFWLIFLDAFSRSNVEYNRKLMTSPLVWRHLFLLREKTFRRFTKLFAYWIFIQFWLRLDSNIESKSSNYTYLNEEQSFDQINMTDWPQSHRVTEWQSDKHSRVLSIWVGEIFLCLISINSPTRFARRGIKY